MLFFVFLSVKAETSNFEKGKNLFDEKKYDLAKIYNFNKNDNQEEKNLNTVILLNPKNEEAILNLAFLKIRKSNYEETKKLIKNFKDVCKKLCEKQSYLQNKLDSVLKK